MHVACICPLTCPKASTILRAISFSSAVRITGKRTCNRVWSRLQPCVSRRGKDHGEARASLPRALRMTLPSTTGDLRASACAYSGPMVYTCTLSGNVVHTQCEAVHMQCTCSAHVVHTQCAAVHMQCTRSAHAVRMQCTRSVHAVHM